eukprot:10255307-Heterocapsa_arctica.AAC.1
MDHLDLVPIDWHYRNEYLIQAFGLNIGHNTSFPGTVNNVYHFRSVVLRAFCVPALHSLMDGVDLRPGAHFVLKRLPEI